MAMTILKRALKERREKKKTRGFGCCYFLMFQDRDVTSTCWVNKVHVADPSSLHTHTHTHTHTHSHSHTHTHTCTHCQKVVRSKSRPCPWTNPLHGKCNYALALAVSETAAADCPKAKMSRMTNYPASEAASHYSSYSCCIATCGVVVPLIPASLWNDSPCS